ncbi:hypothetical protein HQ545_07630 [Candidatus Woesearchaeota archaeon]|nr:hypothetical protein [Candidatus Woesearchaeota archaeon]
MSMNNEYMNIFKKKKKDLDEEIEDLYEVDEDSDFPVREKIVKQKKIRKMQ